jgi:hypothetical protein
MRVNLIIVRPKTMTKRSTLLQRVVFQVERHLARGATVEESVQLLELVSKDPREVDVVIRANIGGHNVVVCIECQDRSRKATIEWVEQMERKHRSLPTSKLILVAVQGFTKKAIAKATEFGIDTYSFDEALAADWNELLGKSMAFDMYAFRIVNCGLVITDIKAKEISVSRQFRIFNGEGSLRGTLGEIVDQVISDSGRFTEQALQFGAADIPAVIGAELRFKSHLFAEDTTGKLHPIELVRVYLEIRGVQTPEHFTPTRYRNTPVAHVHGQSPAGDFVMTLINPAKGLPTGAFTVTNADTGETDTVDVHVQPKDSKLLFLTDRVDGKRK